MRQYDVFINPSSRSRSVWPYVVILQSDVVRRANAVIVAPMTTDPRMEHSRLHPAFMIEGQRAVLMTTDLASIPKSALSEYVTNLGGDWDRITSALDILFTGT